MKRNAEVSKVEMKKRRALKRIYTKANRRDEKAYIKRLMTFGHAMKYSV